MWYYCEARTHFNCVFALLNRYLIQNLDWLEEQLDDVEDDYILFDLPGTQQDYVHC